MRSDDPLLVIRSVSATTFDTALTLIKLLDVLCLIQHLCLAKCNIAEQDDLVLEAGRVLQALLHHVCEVASFAEHVAVLWCFRRGDPHPLRHQAQIVGHARAVEQQTFVANLCGHLFEDFRLAPSLDLEHTEALDWNRMAAWRVGCVEAVSADKITLRVSFLH